MNITLDRRELIDAIATVNGARLKNGHVPAAEGILLAANTQQTNLTAYNLEYGITTEMAGDMRAEEGTVILPPVAIEAIKKLKGDEVNIIANERESGTEILIKSGKSKYSFAGAKTEDFPTLPLVDGTNKVKLKQGTLKDMLQQTIFAVSQNEIQPILTGVNVTSSNKEIRMTALDGHRLSTASISVDAEECEEFQATIPAGTLREISKLLSNSNEYVHMAISGNHVVFEIGGVGTVISLLLNGDFPNIENVLPKGSSAAVVTVDTKDTLNSISRAELLVSANSITPIVCDFKDNRLYISCQTQLGAINDEVSTNHTGDNVKIGFNVKYLIDALKASTSDEVEINLNGGLSPITIVPHDNDSAINSLFLVLPMRIKDA